MSFIRRRFSSIDPDSLPTSITPEPCLISKSPLLQLTATKFLPWQRKDGSYEGKYHSSYPAVDLPAVDLHMSCLVSAWRITFHAFGLKLGWIRIALSFLTDIPGSDVAGHHTHMHARTHTHALLALLLRWYDIWEHLQPKPSLCTLLVTCKKCFLFVFFVNINSCVLLC